ncbi:uncharacterized protein DS421_9g275040 [Arachis hypogaea]|nr:uncharacterized protein DS421_9g275040 [Arachis hypogaea]
MTVTSFKLAIVGRDDKRKRINGFYSDMIENQQMISRAIVQWMCFTFNDSESSRFKDEFYCIPPGILETMLQKMNLDSFREVSTLSYVVLGPNFGADTRYFDKVAAFRRKWYAFEVSQKRLWVLDSMHFGAHNDEQLKIDAYAGRIIEDVAKVSMPAYEPKENGRLVSMPASQNNLTEALEALDDHLVRRNQPKNKSKTVRSPFTAPSTKTMLQRAGLPMRKPSKREDNERRKMPSCWYFKHYIAFPRNQSTQQVTLDKVTGANTKEPAE